MEPSFYLFLQKRLFELSEKRLDRKLTRKEAETVLAYTRIPKSLMPIMMRELQRLELIKVINRNHNVHIEVINERKCKILNRLNKLSHSIGIF